MSEHELTGTLTLLSNDMRPLGSAPWRGWFVNGLNLTMLVDDIECIDTGVPRYVTVDCPGYFEVVTADRPYNLRYDYCDTGKKVRWFPGDTLNWGGQDIYKEASYTEAFVRILEDRKQELRRIAIEKAEKEYDDVPPRQ